MQFAHENGLVKFGFTLILFAWRFERAFSPKASETRKHLMNTLNRFFSTLFGRMSNAAAARGLFERAATSRGLSHNEAAQLRINALALLSVVR